MDAEGGWSAPCQGLAFQLPDTVTIQPANNQPWPHVANASTQSQGRLSATLFFSGVEKRRASCVALWSVAPAMLPPQARKTRRLQQDTGFHTPFIQGDIVTASGWIDDSTSR